MSGPVGPEDAVATAAMAPPPQPATVEVAPSRQAVVGGLDVRRALPRRERRSVGAWNRGSGPGGPAPPPGAQGEAP